MPVIIVGGAGSRWTSILVSLHTTRGHRGGGFLHLLTFPAATQTLAMPAARLEQLGHRYREKPSLEWCVVGFQLEKSSCLDPGSR